MYFGLQNHQLVTTFQCSHHMHILLILLLLGVVPISAMVEVQTNVVERNAAQEEIRAMVDAPATPISSAVVVLVTPAAAGERNVQVISAMQEDAKVPLAVAPLAVAQEDAIVRLAPLAVAQEDAMDVLVTSVAQAVAMDVLVTSVAQVVAVEASVEIVSMFTETTIPCINITE